MTIDVHVHMGTFPSIEGSEEHLRSRADVAAFRSKHPETYRRFGQEAPVDNSSRLIAVMDRYEIDRALIQPRPGVSNELIRDMCTANPDRLTPLALPTPWPVPGDPPGRTAETGLGQGVATALDHCFNNLGMKAAGEIYVRRVTSAVDPERIADDFLPVMSLLAHHQAPLEIPTAWTQFPGGLFYGDPTWVDELAQRHPDVPIILTKMGRGIQRYFEAAMVVALRNSNVYFDTSDTTVPHLSEAISRLGADRILFGTDWSATWQFMTNPDSAHGLALSTVKAATKDPGVIKAVRDSNARRLFAMALSA